jgi:hypothetical protein
MYLCLVFTEQVKSLNPDFKREQINLFSLMINDIKLLEKLWDASEWKDIKIN